MLSQEEHRGAEVSELSWTFSTMYLFIISRFQAQRDEFLAADKRYEQRFIAQECAVQSSLIAQEKAVNAALIAADRAVTKAELSAEKRFEAVNEFRAALTDQAILLLPRTEAEQRFVALADRVARMESSMATAAGIQHQEGVGGTRTMWAIGILVSVILSIVSILIRIR